MTVPLDSAVSPHPFVACATPSSVPLGTEKWRLEPCDNRRVPHLASSAILRTEGSFTQSCCQDGKHTFYTLLFVKLTNQFNLIDDHFRDGHCWGSRHMCIIIMANLFTAASLILNLVGRK